MRWPPVVLCLAYGCAASGGCDGEGEGSSTAQRAAHSPAEAASDPSPEPVRCPRNWGNCDGRSDNGCEQRLDSQAHCGQCGRVCGRTSACLRGACRQGMVQVSAGGSHSCALHLPVGVFCWGLNGVGQLGLPSPEVRPTPVRLEGRPNTLAVAAGRYHTCVLSRAGKVRCWGEAYTSEPSDATTRQWPRLITEVSPAQQVAAAAAHTCALHGGEVSCWGSNIEGQLGAEREAYLRDPVRIAGLDDATFVAAGNAHTCAVRANHRVVCWGFNRFGQLGDGSTESSKQPRAVSGDFEAERLALGAFHSCAVSRAGKLYCWGRNESGQLGDGSRTDRLTPVLVPLVDVVQVSAGQRHTCALERSGEVYCWGSGRDGRLGLGSGTSYNRPRAVGLEGLSISAGEMHTCALDTEQRVFCWGLNDGQLGDGTLKTRAKPVRVRLPPQLPLDGKGPRD